MSIPMIKTEKLSHTYEDENGDLVYAVKDVSLTVEEGEFVAVIGTIGSGNIDVTYIVATQRGTILDSSQSVMVRLRAQWEDIGTWSIAGLVAVAFCVGLIRNVRSQWRSRDPLVSSRRKHTHSDDGDTP